MRGLQYYARKQVIDRSKELSPHHPWLASRNISHKPSTQSHPSLIILTLGRAHPHKLIARVKQISIVTKEEREEVGRLVGSCYSCLAILPSCRRLCGCNSIYKSLSDTLLFEVVTTIREVMFLFMIWHTQRSGPAVGDSSWVRCCLFRNHTLQVRQLPIALTTDLPFVVLLRWAVDRGVYLVRCCWDTAFRLQLLLLLLLLRCLHALREWANLFTTALTSSHQLIWLDLPEEEHLLSSRWTLFLMILLSSPLTTRARFSWVILALMNEVREARGFHCVRRISVVFKAPAGS